MHLRAQSPLAVRRAVLSVGGPAAVPAAEQASFTAAATTRESPT